MPPKPWRLSKRDSRAFIDNLLHPPEPNAALKAAAAKYKQTIESGTLVSYEVKKIQIATDGATQEFTTVEDFVAYLDSTVRDS
jgi:hypothetical protein